MNDERPDQVVMIGLHKLAQFGDGCVPELCALLERRTRLIEDNPNVAEFPAWQARPPARKSFGLALEQRDNILPFPSAAEGAVPNKDRA